MAKTKYELLRSRSQGEVEEEEIGFEFEEAKQTIASDILATQKALSTAKRELKEAEGAFPFDSKKVVEKELGVEGYTAGLTRLLNIQERLFGIAATKAVSEDK